MKIGSGIRMSVVVAGTLVVHEGLLRGLRIDGVRPEPVLGLAVVAGLAGGSERGAVVGFASGLLADLFLPTPLGLSALVCCVTAYVVGIVKVTVLPTVRGTYIATMFAGSAGGVAVFAFFGALVGLPGTISTHLVTVMVIVAFTNAALCAPLLRMVRWSLECEPREPSNRGTAGWVADAGRRGPMTGLKRR